MNNTLIHDYGTPVEKPARAGVFAGQLRPALVILVALTAITGALYPAVVTGLAKLLFPRQAAGSVITNPRGDAIGSELIGQPFADAGFFWPRPSATSPAYNGAGGSGSNLGPTSPALLEAVADRAAKLRGMGPHGGAVPVDLVTASGSGLDPHISPAAARYQVARVAAARGMTPEEVQTLVDAHTEGRTFRVLGEPRVNVLKVNLALDGR